MEKRLTFDDYYAQYVFSLPMRDGNPANNVVISGFTYVFSLPMRDGNLSSIVAILYHCLVFSLPMRDGNMVTETT